MAFYCKKVPNLMQSCRWLLVMAVCGFLASEGFSEAGRRAFAFQLRLGSSSTRQEALQSIPLEKLDPAGRQKVLNVVQESCFFRRLPIAVIRCDPELYLFVVQHPDVIVGIWQQMGITQIELEQIGPSRFRYADVDGTRGVIEYLYSSHDVQIIFSEATYEGPLFNRIVRSQAVIVLKSGYVLETNGQYYVTSRLDAFVSVDKAAWEALTKTFHPLIGRIADANFMQTVQFVGLLHETACQNPDGMQRLAAKLQTVKPHVRAEFAAVLAKVAERSRQLESSNGPVVADRPGVTPRK